MIKHQKDDYLNLPQNVKNCSDVIQELYVKIENLEIINNILLEEISQKLKLSIQQHVTGNLKHKTKIDLSKLRLSEKACPTASKNQTIEFPPKSLRDGYLQTGLNDLSLAGFENNGGCSFNFILDNGLKLHNF